MAVAGIPTAGATASNGGLPLAAGCSTGVFFETDDLDSNIIFGYRSTASVYIEAGVPRPADAVIVTFFRTDGDERTELASSLAGDDGDEIFTAFVYGQTSFPFPSNRDPLDPLRAVDRTLLMEDTPTEAVIQPVRFVGPEGGTQRTVPIGASTTVTCPFWTL